MDNNRKTEYNQNEPDPQDKGKMNSSKSLDPSDVKNIEDDFHRNDDLLASNPDDFDEGDYDGTGKREIRTPGL